MQRTEHRTVLQMTCIQKKNGVVNLLNSQVKEKVNVINNSIITYVNIFTSDGDHTIL